MFQAIYTLCPLREHVSYDMVRTVIYSHFLEEIYVSRDTTNFCRVGLRNRALYTDWIQRMFLTSATACILDTLQEHPSRQDCSTTIFVQDP